MPDGTPTVGFVGLGRMGLPMCRNLLRRGFPLVVHNRTEAKAAPLRALGAAVAPSAGELARRADVVLTCLDSVAASETTFLADDGVIARARPGAILIDHGTIGPDTARAIGARASARGLPFLDAPVSGGPEGAEAGTLAIMAGGPAEAFARVRPVLESYGGTVVRMGEVGTGSLTKLVNQLLTFVHGAAAAEALAFAERANLDLAALGKVLKVSFGQSRMLDRTLGRVLEGNFEAGAPLRLYRKDLGLIVEAGQAAGAGLPLTAAVERILERALAGGFSDRDIAALVLLYRQG